MKRVLILSTQEGVWEALFIDGKLIEEGESPLGEGNSNLFLLEKAEEYKFTSSDIELKELDDCDEVTIAQYGSIDSMIDANLFDINNYQ